MTHANLVATIAGVIAVVPNVDHNDTYIAYLPCAHVLELCAEVREKEVEVCLLLQRVLFLIKGKEGPITCESQEG